MYCNWTHIDKILDLYLLDTFGTYVEHYQTLLNISWIIGDVSDK